MTHTFQVDVTAFETLQEVAGQWTPKDYTALLDAMEFGDSTGLDDTELRDMCLMSLQDQEPEAAALFVLQHIIGEDLRDGQLRNMANEMRTEKLWEEYVDPAFHARLFTVGSLLYAAQPSVFPKTDAVRVTLDVTTPDADANDLLAPTLNPAFLARLLAGGMDDHAVLNRLYGEQLAGTSFPNASDIIWTATAKETSKDHFAVEILSSGYWLDAFERTASYEVQAHGDLLIET